jgi:hypothetical protein
MRRLPAAALAAALLVSTGGCGSAGRPSADQLSAAIRTQAGKGGDAFVKQAVTRRSADCMGRVLYRSRLSDAALRALVDGRKGYHATSADKQAMRSLAPRFIDCIPEMKQLRHQLGQLTGSPTP